MDADQINEIQKSVGRYLGVYLFSLEKSKYKNFPGKGDIPPDFTDKFNLSARARLYKGEAGKWTLRDGDRAFSIIEEGDHLSISLMPRSTFQQLVLPAWEVLFEVDYGHAKDLDAQKIPGEWKQIFEKEGFPLSAGAGVGIKGTGKKKWILRDRGHAYLIRPRKGRLQVSLYESAFEKLVQHVREEIKMEGDDDLEFRVVVACCLLGPKDIDLGGSVYEPLLAEMRRLDSEEQNSRILELAFAFGCGKWRAANPRSQGWDGIWEGAFRALTPILERPMAHVVRFFGIPTVDVDIKSDAAFIADSLIEPERLRFSLDPQKEIRIKCLPGGSSIQLPLGTDPIEINPGMKCVLMVNGAGVLALDGKERIPIPSGSRIIIEAGDQETKINLINEKGKNFRREARENITINGSGGQMEVSVRKCACGTAACARHHDLSKWDPTYSLYAFLSAAVNGVARKGTTHFKPGAFVQGMYFPLLAESRQMRYGKVEFIQCACGKKHKGRSCPQCGEAFDPKKMKRIGKDHLFFVGEKGYYRKGFASCMECENHVEISEDDVVNEVFCSHRGCKSRLFDEKIVKAIFRKYKDLSARKKAFRKMREALGTCPGCQRKVEKIQWNCPICHESEFGQRLVYLWVNEPSGVNGPANADHADEEAGDE